MLVYPLNSELTQWQTAFAMAPPQRLDCSDEFLPGPGAVNSCRESSFDMTPTAFDDEQVQKGDRWNRIQQ